MTEKMQKKLLPLTALVLGAASLLCWPLLVRRQAAVRKEYESLLSRADVLLDKGIYADAGRCLEQAEALEGISYEGLLKLAECYRETGKNDAFFAACARAIAKEPADDRAYLLEAEWYKKGQKISEAFRILEAAERNGCASEAIRTLKNELDSCVFRQYISADAVGDWRCVGESAYAVFSSSDCCGILRADGTVTVSAKWPYLGIPDAETETLPCLHNGVFCFVTAAGERKYVPDISAESLGSFSAGLAPFSADGKAGYLDTAMQVRSTEFREAGAFSEGVAAVNRDGMWALLDTGLNSITPFSFTDIRRDSYGFCAAYGRCAVKSGEYWYLADLQGNMLSAGADNVCLPASLDGDIAFCKNGLWGFLDREGKVTLSPQYAEAASFSCGFAPVRDEEGWHYIRQDGTPVGDEIFEEAGVFSPEGRAAVRQNGAMLLLVIGRYYE